MSHIVNILKSYFVVFNPTASDWDNANETQATAQKDILGVRYWLSKKSGSQGYNFEGVGNYAGGVIVDIPAVFMTPNELDILNHSPNFCPYGFDILKCVTNQYFEAENNFKNEVLNILQYILLKQNALPTSIKQAYNALSTFINSLQSLDIDNAYLSLNDTSPAGSFTALIKADVQSLFVDHLTKYPR